jgi:peptide deformylase
MPAVAIRKIAQLGEPVLRQVARPLSRDELRSPAIQQLIDDMIETMHDADGAGLAAPQVYESVQLCVIEITKNPRYPDALDIPLTVLVNPVVTPAVGSSAGALATEDSIAMFEGCLSVTGLRGLVVRPRRVRVQALDRHGAELDFVWEGVRASVVQHETDHLNGTLYVDRADSRSLTFLREYERYVPREERIVDRGAR